MVAEAASLAWVLSAFSTAALETIAVFVQAGPISLEARVLRVSAHPSRHAWDG
jgi:hypothetical protein